VFTLFRSLPDPCRKVALDGIFSLCSWPQLVFASATLKPLMRVDFVSVLPSEIAWKIMSHLDAISLCKASLVKCS